MKPIVDADKFSALRWRARLNKSELARRSGVSRETIHRIEAGRAIAFRLDTLAKLALVLGVDALDLLTKKDA